MPPRLALAALMLLAACAPRAATPTVRTANKGASVASPWERDPSRGPRALVFRASGFPTIDAPPIDDATLDAALSGISVVRASTTEEIASKLWLRDVDVLVLSYGSAFPIDAWSQIEAFLRYGGGLVVLGGAPLHEPVRLERAAWVRGPRQPAFAHHLLVGPAEPIAIGADFKPDPTLKSPIEMPIGKTTWALTLRLTTEKEFPDEHGSAGPRESVARPLARISDAAGTPRGCSLIEIDRVSGPSKGGRLVFATTDAKLEAPTIKAIVLRALEGASELRIAPRLASLPQGAKAELFVSTDRVAANGQFHVRVTDDEGSVVLDTKRSLSDENAGFGASIVIETVLPPGLYHASIEDAHGRTARTGFWVKDPALLKSGSPLTVSPDWLRRDGKVFPVVGTTYMASDVHRHFLFEPNPDVWDTDFAEMKRRGVTFVRTGLWTAWSRVMPKPNQVDPNVLAALEAFVLTAAKHGIVVCFNLFAFLPPSYGGVNPYLDPKAIAGQKALIAALAERFRDSPWIHWDLINEPSYAPLAKLWTTRAIGDTHEHTAWRQWVRAQHQRDGETDGKLRALWRTPNLDLYEVPRDQDFTVAPVQVDRRPRKTRDFREFVEDTVAGWAYSMRATIRDAAGPGTLVTLGQDEGGIYERPTQQLMAHALDYTSVHTWWKNDDLLWDGVITKVAGKPSLHQETGLMRLESIDGIPWRTPEDAALLLDRKLGYAFAARGAGVVEWVWNVNPYMPIDEESTIGLFRPDGTAKPELDALERYATFFSKAAPSLDDFEADPVVLVIPHARTFLGMPGSIDASKHVVRALAERFGVVPTAVSDLRIGRADRLKGAKLVIVPSPSVLDEDAAKALVNASKRGTKVLITGAIEGDSYGLETASLRALNVLGPSRPVAMHEKSKWSPSGWVAFEGLLQETARRADKPSRDLTATDAVWHEPLPLELARDREPLVRLLRAALTAAKVTMSPDDGGGGVAGRVLIGPKSALVVVVNERAEPAKRTMQVDGRPVDVAVPARASRVMLVERWTGKVLASTK